MPMAGKLRWVLCGAIVCIIFVVPIIHYRATYAHSKRLRVIDPGRVYRSGQMTAAGFEDTIRRLGIRTIVNLQDDCLDPDLTFSYFDRQTIKESDFCARLGVRFLTISPDLVPRRQSADRRPHAIEEMLAIFDNPASYPVLIHCRAGLHRTGCMAAIYRMEYQSWSPEQAVEEMKDHGFGDRACTAANDYVYQYVLTYQRGMRDGHASAPFPHRQAKKN
jgi:tyrosine-protein phosphatase SIW14